MLPPEGNISSSKASPPCPPKYFEIVHFLKIFLHHVKQNLSMLSTVRTILAVLSNPFVEMEYSIIIDIDIDKALIWGMLLLKA